MLRLFGTVLAGLALAGIAAAQEITTAKIHEELIACSGRAVAQAHELVDLTAEAAKDTADPGMAVVVAALPAPSPSPEDLIETRQKLAQVEAGPGDPFLSRYRARGAESWTTRPDKRLSAIDYYTRLSADTSCAGWVEKAEPLIAAKLPELSRTQLVVEPAYLDLLTAEPGDVTDAQTAVKLLSMFYADDQIGTRERGLLLSLVYAPQLTLEDGERTVTLPPLSERAHLMLLVFSARFDVADLWPTTPKLMETLTLISQVSPAIRGQVRDGIASGLMESWQRSQITNAYEPFRAKISRAYRMSRVTEDEATGRMAGRLLFDAAERFDQVMRDSVPDHLYSWLKTAVEAPREG